MEVAGLDVGAAGFVIVYLLILLELLAPCTGSYWLHGISGFVYRWLK